MQVIKSYLNIPERISFVDTVVKLSEVDNRYEPALYDFAFRIACAVYFTDVDTTSKTNDELAEIAYSDDITNIMLSGINQHMLSMLEEACREKIEQNEKVWIETYKSLIQPNPFNEVMDMLQGALKEIGEKFDAETIVNEIVNRNNDDNKEQLPTQNPQTKKRGRPVKSGK